MSLTQLERDLARYATDKTYTLCNDIAQSFDIANVKRERAVACMGSVFLRMAVTLALHATDVNKARWLQLCAEVYDQAAEAKRQNP